MKMKSKTTDLEKKEDSKKRKISEEEDGDKDTKGREKKEDGDNEEKETKRMKRMEEAMEFVKSRLHAMVTEHRVGVSDFEMSVTDVTNFVTMVLEKIKDVEVEGDDFRRQVDEGEAEYEDFEEFWYDVQITGD